MKWLSFEVCIPENEEWACNHDFFAAKICIKPLSLLGFEQIVAGEQFCMGRLGGFGGFGGWTLTCLGLKGNLIRLVNRSSEPFPVCGTAGEPPSSLCDFNSVSSLKSAHEISIRLNEKAHRQAGGEAAKQMPSPQNASSWCTSASVTQPRYQPIAFHAFLRDNLYFRTGAAIRRDKKGGKRQSRHV